MSGDEFSDADRGQLVAEYGSPPGEGRFRARVHRPHRGLAVLEVAGPVDLVTTRRFEDLLQARLASCVSRLVVDLSGVTFFSARAISVLLRAKHQAGTAGTHLSLITGTHAVDRPLQALDLTTRFAYSDRHPGALIEPGGNSASPPLPRPPGDVSEPGSGAGSGGRSEL